MGTVVTIANSKGGGGKTSLVACLAVYLADTRRVAVIDSDRSQIFARWHARAYEGPAISVSSEIRQVEIINHALRVAPDHDVTLIDTAGFENLTAAHAIGVADHVLIPCMPDAGCATQTIETAHHVANLARAARRSIPASVVRVRWNPRGLAEGATLADLTELDVLEGWIPKSALIEQMSYSGAVPARRGRLGPYITAIVDELASRGAIPDAQLKEHSAA